MQNFPGGRRNPPIVASASFQIRRCYETRLGILVLYWTALCRSFLRRSSSATLKVRNVLNRYMSSSRSLSINLLLVSSKHSLRIFGPFLLDSPFTTTVVCSVSYTLVGCWLCHLLWYCSMAWSFVIIYQTVFGQDESRDPFAVSESLLLCCSLINSSSVEV